jgi:anti-sigma-K factor RskA
MSDQPDQHDQSPNQPDQRPDRPSANPPRPWEQTQPLVTHPIGPRHADPEDIALFAMQLLTGEEAAAIAQHTEHCAECRRELAHVQGDLGAYAFTVEMHEPAATAKQRFMRQVAREKRAVPTSNPVIAAYGRNTSIFGVAVEEEQKPRRQIGRGFLMWSGWAIAASLAVAASFLDKDRESMQESARLNADAAHAHQLMDALTDPKAVRVTLTAKPLPKTGPIGGATYNPDKGTLIFIASELDPLKDLKTYELWILPADDSAPIPAGIFHPDERGDASLILPDVPKGIAAKGFGVTIEDEGGSQTPTKPLVLASL